MVILDEVEPTRAGTRSLSTVKFRSDKCLLPSP